MSALTGTSVLEGELAKAPRDWPRRKFKYLTQESRVKFADLQTSAQMLSVSGYDGVVPKQYEDANQMRSETDLANYLVVKPLQLAVNCMWLNYCGLGVSAYEGLISPAYRVYNLGVRLYPAYCHYLLRSNGYVGEYTRLGYGIRPNSLQVSREDFGGLPVPFPPLQTQTTIAAYLDRKTAAIDALIEKKRRLVQLLAEKRAALINCAVTKGLDPTVPMKDSGIPWIGEIPEHWTLHRLKQTVKESVAGPYGSSLTKAMYVESGYRVYGQQQVIADDFRLGDYYISADKFVEMSRYLVHPGDVLVTVMGTIGRVAVVPEDAEPGIINPRLVRYRPDLSLILPRYMQISMLAVGAQTALGLAAQGTTMDGLNMGSVGDLVLAIPPLSEQKAILLDTVERKSGLEALERRVFQQIERLQEYRQALITAAVTGQLEVPIDESVPEEAQT